MNAKHRITLLFLVTLLCLSPAMAQESGWPRNVALDEGTVTIYEPQVDEISDDFIRFRAALAYREKPGDEPVFGAGWFESGLKANRFSGTVHPVGMKVTQTRFPMDAKLQARLSEAMADPAFAVNFVFTAKELEESARIARAEAEAAEQIETAPPKVIYRDSPALLVTIDGEPVLRDIENTPYEAVINTPYPLIHDGSRFYLNAAKDVWYRAPDATGPYRFTAKVPADIAALVQPGEGEESEAQTIERVTAANAPEIVVSTEPAELIVTDGPAAFVPLVDELLVLNNSDDDVFMHLGEQRYYIVLAGRWYRSESLDGPWSYRDAADLPTAFTQIPADSEQADSRVYVAGTEEAEEAVIDAQLPQTAAVERGEADIEVVYDGEPVFAPVDGTDMVYATNTGSTVIYANGLYYMVEDGVWYVSRSWDGPWQVSVARPDQVRVILPTSPVYNVKYVYVYDYTPNVVYVGYTPGYLGSYVYRRTVFYGSGYYYAPWVTSRWYYPHHRTWGFHVRYDPWYGWNFGVSWAWGPFSFSYWPGGHWHHHHRWHHRHYGYWGPHGYRPRHHYRHDYHDGRGRGYNRPPRHGPNPRERHYNLYADAQQRGHIVRTKDKQPRSVLVKGVQGKGGKTLAKNGSGLKAKSKLETAYAPGKTVSKSDLSRKAAAPGAKVKSGKSSKQLQTKAKYAPGKTVSKTDLAHKARTTRSLSKAGKSSKQLRTKSMHAAGTTVSKKELALKAPAGKSKSRTAGKQLSIENGRAGAVRSAQKTVTTPKTVTAKNSRKVVSDKAGRSSGTVREVKTTSRKSVSTSRSAGGIKVKNAGPSRKAVTTKQYSSVKTMPTVRVTNPQPRSSSAFAGSARSATRAPSAKQSSSPYKSVERQAPAPRAAKVHKSSQPKSSRGGMKNSKQGKSRAQ
ncbi:MAG: hypothetical protein V2I79_05815 [Xanthomonadales bacterium]|jgi:hypothetical protein|nr:hypothetical protein [Xanthomonadales bacterium]